MKPILFSAPMVRAILDGRKTQTRRAIKTHRSDGSFVCVDYGAGWWPYRSEDGESEFMPDGCEYPYACPYGAPGDLLYVKEAWRASSAHNDLPPSQIPVGDSIEYCADPQRIVTGRSRHGRFMPRWASRITLEITDVRVERLQEISEVDARAEGAPVGEATDGPGCHALGFMDLWESINGEGSWALNPWVWCVSFRRIEGAK